MTKDGWLKSNLRVHQKAAIKSFMSHSGMDRINNKNDRKMITKRFARMSPEKLPTFWWHDIAKCSHPLSTTKVVDFWCAWSSQNCRPSAFFHELLDHSLRNCRAVSDDEWCDREFKRRTWERIVSPTKFDRSIFTQNFSHVFRLKKPVDVWCGKCSQKMFARTFAYK